jgi:3-hydroxybutyrate dehydrogenase
MKKKTALITGSTSGIGLSIAKAFAAKGYNLVMNGLEENGAEIASEISQPHKTKYLFSPANMLQLAQLDTLVRQCVEHFGSLDILINNAGIQYVSPIENFPTNKWDEVIAVNLTAPFHLTKAVWPFMKNQHFGRIINISSIHGLVASEFKSAYVASKHGLLGLTKTIALEGAPYNITCNAICPGYVKTPLVEKQIPDQMRNHNLSEWDVISKVMLAKQTVKQFVSADLVAEMALLMASDAASTLTGCALPIDGGWSAQ